MNPPGDPKLYHRGSILWLMRFFFRFCRKYFQMKVDRWFHGRCVTNITLSIVTVKKLFIFLWFGPCLPHIWNAMFKTYTNSDPHGLQWLVYVPNKLMGHSDQWFYNPLAWWTSGFNLKFQDIIWKKCIAVQNSVISCTKIIYAAFISWTISVTYIEVTKVQLSCCRYLILLSFDKTITPLWPDPYVCMHLFIGYKYRFKYI